MFAMALVMALPLALTSCSDDDEENGGGNSSKVSIKVEGGSPDKPGGLCI